jgi:hypothetical protein
MLKKNLLLVTPTLSIRRTYSHIGSSSSEFSKADAH